MGLDVDGDAMAVVKADQYPELFKACQRIPEGSSPKLEKSKSPIGTNDRRTEMIIKSMMSLVGMASNLTSTTFMVEDRELLAHELGFKNARSMDERLNFFIKVGTDGFKTLIDQEPIRKHMSVLQAKLQKMFGVSAPWTNWPNEGAFSTFIPEIFRQGMNTARAKESIKPFMDGTVAQICRITLPNLQNILNEPIKTRPLTYYRDWAPMVSAEHYANAANLCDYFEARSRLVNWSDTKSVVQFKVALQAKVAAWLEECGMSELEGAYALWKVAHSKKNGSGAPVFFCFPELCKGIVQYKPGQRSRATVITGVKYQLPHNPDTLEVKGRIVEVEVRKDNQVLVRKCLVAEVDGQTQPAMPWPTNLIGVVDEHSNQPECGEYQCRITRNTANSWVLELY